MSMSVSSLQQTHKFLDDQEGDDPSEDPQTHGHHVTMGSTCGEHGLELVGALHVITET